MIIPQPIAHGAFKKRYKRFFADIAYKNELITAHVPNTGSLKTCLNENADCLFTILDKNSHRKLLYTLQAIKTPNSWVGVNTSLANDLVWEAWKLKNMSHWRHFLYGKKEVKINEHTRIDMAFWKEDLSIDVSKKIDPNLFKKHSFHFVEVKNVTMAEDRVALFPDAETERGQKHLVELMKLMTMGHTCEIFFVIQRTDCEIFSPASKIDKKYAELLVEANKKGVKISPYACSISENEIKIIPDNPLKLLL
jgi:sugar fermentation stimulation protein A